jgi:hypothetical protein
MSGTSREVSRWSVVLRADEPPISISNLVGTALRQKRRTDSFVSRLSALALVLFSSEQRVRP